MKRSTLRQRNQARRRAKKELRRRRQVKAFSRSRGTALERLGIAGLVDEVSKLFVGSAGADRAPAHRGRCPVCARAIARARIGQVALERLSTHGRRRGSSHGARTRLPKRRPCAGSGAAPIKRGTS